MDTNGAAKTMSDMKEHEHLWVKTETGIGRAYAYYPNRHWRSEGHLSYIVHYYDHKDSWGDYPLYSYSEKQIEQFIVIEEPLQSRLEQAHQAYEAALENFEELVEDAAK